MRFVVVIILLVGLAGCSSPSSLENSQTGSSSPAQADSAATITDELQGRWQVISLLKDGQETHQPGAVPLEMEFKNGTQTITQGGKLHDKSQYSIDPTATPKSIDTIMKAGGGTTATSPGIYEVQGDDLKLCITPPGKPRPTDFSSSAHTNLVVLKRITAK